MSPFSRCRKKNESTSINPDRVTNEDSVTKEQSEVKKGVESLPDKEHVGQKPEEKEPTENQTSDKETGEIQSLTSAPDPEGTSSSAPDLEGTSSGTPSNIYNPKDSDSLVPMQLLGSFHGSLDGVTASLLENGEAGDSSNDRETGVVISPSSLREESNMAASEEVKPGGNGTIAEVDSKHGENSLSSNNGVPDDSDSRRLLH